MAGVVGRSHGLSDAGRCVMSDRADLILVTGVLLIAVGLLIGFLRALWAADRADWRALRADRAARHWRARAIRAEQSVWGIDPQPGPPPHTEDITPTQAEELRARIEDWRARVSADTIRMLPVPPDHEIRSHREEHSDAT